MILKLQSIFLTQKIHNGNANNTMYKKRSNDARGTKWLNKIEQETYFDHPKNT